MRPQTKYALSGDVHIAYQVTGEGPYDIVLAPGTMSHLDLDWEIPNRARFIERLSSICRLIRFDKRGTGLSDRPVKMATLEERTDDIRAVMDAVGIQRTNLFGASEGGSMACLFAATYPDRVDHLLIWGAMARWIRTADHPWGQNADAYHRMLEMISDDWPSEEYVRGPGAGLGSADAAAVERVMWYMRTAANPSAVLAYEQMNAEIDTRSILPAIHAPVLVMNRSGDPVADVKGARDLASRIPNAKFIEYPGDSHSMMLPDMETILADINQFITGERNTGVTDRVLATVLFADIVSSTDQAAQLGDAAWKSILNSYYSIARKEVVRFRGVEVGTSGDGYLARFDGPARAISCALAMSDAVRELDIEIRCGVHTGECEEMGANLGGIAVHIGARVMAQAGPSQVLVSSTVKDLVAGSGLAFSEAGKHQLKGIPGEWTLYQATCS